MKEKNVPQTLKESLIEENFKPNLLGYLQDTVYSLKYSVNVNDRVKKIKIILVSALIRTHLPRANSLEIDARFFFEKKVH